MANKSNHRRFGNVRKLPSGRFQARYLGPDGLQKFAPETYARKGDAEQYLSLVEVQIMKGEWVDPERGKVPLGDYATTWIKERPGLRPRTVDLYERLLRLHITPYLGKAQLGKIAPQMIRTWRADLLAKGVSVTTAAKAYRLLRAVLMTAVNEDRILLRNPCQIKGAGNENAPERPVLTVAQVFELADMIGRRPVGNVRQTEDGFRLRYRIKGGAMRSFPEPFTTRMQAEHFLWQLMHDGRADFTRDDRLRLLVLLGAFASLRWGEVTALHRHDLDLANAKVRVRAAYSEHSNGRMVLGPPKSRAGVRTVNIPASIIPDIQGHLDKYAKPGPNALVFSGINGAPLRRSNFRRPTRWQFVVAALGVPGLHFHDLRHTGNMLAAQTGATLKDLMTRMGHDDERAALIYQHASDKADQAIARGIDDLVKAVREPDDKDGEAGALVPMA